MAENGLILSYHGVDHDYMDMEFDSVVRGVVFDLEKNELIGEPESIALMKLKAL